MRVAVKTFCILGTHLGHISPPNNLADKKLPERKRDIEGDGQARPWNTAKLVGQHTTPLPELSVPGLNVPRSTP